jgi:membrane protein DedA with SNARE-associated domain
MMMRAVIVSVSPSLGLPALAALVFGESAGLPLPGETALIVAGGLAAAGQLSLPAVILVAAVAATTGDMLGYWIGRRGGRRLLLREGRFAAHRHHAVAKADHYFERYGVTTVFFARFIPGVRVVGALAAGASEMRWRSFAIANVLGCITWATTVASFAYVAGPEGTIVLIALGLTVAAVGFVATARSARRERALAAAAVAVAGDPAAPPREFA